MSKTFCPLPFNHLYLKPNGKFKPCCRFRGELKDKRPIQEFNNLDDVLESDSLENIRAAMIAGEPVSGCKACYDEEASGSHSMRLGEIKHWGDIDKFTAKETNTVSNIDITVGNYCNLACRTCGSTLSTSWDKEDGILKHFYPERAHVSTRLNVNKDWKPEEFLNVEKIKITGGEPMLHPDFLAFLDTIIASGVADNMEIQIFTNASFVPKPYLLERLNKFKHMGVYLSIDGTGKIQEYIRHNSKWETVIDSTRRWFEFQNEYPNNVQINLGATVSIYNIFNLVDLLTWFIDLRSNTITDQNAFTNCTCNITTWPDNIDIKHLIFKEEIIKVLREYYETFELPQLKNYKELVNQVIQRLQTKGNKREIIQFVQINKDLDSMRQQDFTTTFPELYTQIQHIWDEIPGRIPLSDNSW